MLFLRWFENTILIVSKIWRFNPYPSIVDKKSTNREYCGASFMDKKSILTFRRCMTSSELKIWLWIFVHEWRSTSRLSGIEIKSYVQILDFFVGLEKIVHFRISLTLACSSGWYRMDWRLKRQLTLNTWIGQNRTQSFFL